MTHAQDPVQQQIHKTIQDHDVVLYMKGTPQFPMCGFSSKVAQRLQALKAPFHSINVLDDESIRQGIKVYSDWPTIPQLYIDGTFIGGCDIVCDLYDSGELYDLLEPFTPK